MDEFSKALAVKDEGSYFIPESVLVLMAPDQLTQATEASLLIMQQNPQYVFTVISEIVSGGITIHWRKKSPVEESHLVWRENY